MIPRVDAPVSGESAVAKQRGNLRGTETVLVVEDERLVRDLTVGALRRSGYKVLEAENGVKALRVAEDWGREIDIVLTDAIMPGKISPVLEAKCPDALNQASRYLLPGKISVLPADVVRKCDSSSVGTCRRASRADTSVANVLSSIGRTALSLHKMRSGF